MKANEYSFSLSAGQELKYEFPHGQVNKAKCIVIYGPKVKSIKHTAALKQIVNQAMMKFATSSSDETVAQEAKPAKETIEEKASGIVTLISGVEGVDYAKFIDVGIEMLKQGELALIDGEVLLDDGFIDQMDADEFELLLGLYIVNFILSSQMKS